MSDDVDCDPLANYRIVARAFYEKNKELLQTTAKLQGEVSKWLTATTAALHFGSLYILATTSIAPNGARQTAAIVEVLGIILILLCGLATWANWNFNVRAFFEWTNESILVDPEKWPTENRHAKPVIWTMWLAVALGVASALCFPAAAGIVLSAGPSAH